MAFGIGSRSYCLDGGAGGEDRFRVWGDVLVVVALGLFRWNIGGLDVGGPFVTTVLGRRGVP